MDSEKVLEKHLSKKLNTLKYHNANKVGYPDRIVLLPNGKVEWVELKTKGCKPTKIQLTRHNELRAIGHSVYVIDNMSDLVNYINRVQQNE